DGNRVVRLDATSGALISSFDGTTSAAGRVTGTKSIAVAPNSDVYVVDDPGRVEHFAADGSWKGSLDLPTALFTPDGVAVDPLNGDAAIELPASGVGLGLGPDPT